VGITGSVTWVGVCGDVGAGVRVEVGVVDPAQPTVIEIKSRKMKLTINFDNLIITSHFFYVISDPLYIRLKVNSKVLVLSIVQYRPPFISLETPWNGSTCLFLPD